jgi:hypothetical protein
VLQYGIGAALGVHGRNDPAAMAEFLAWYGVPAGALVSAPVEAGSGHGHGHGGAGAVAPAGAPRVALQPAAAFFELEADLFGRATREFYEGLARWAGAPGEAAALRALGGDACEAAFAAREGEGATFADALRDFPSARPPLSELVALLPRIKPRHYSIASSQRAHPTEVHLLVVEVEWITGGARRRVRLARFSRAQPRAARGPSAEALPASSAAATRFLLHGGALAPLPGGALAAARSPLTRGAARWLLRDLHAPTGPAAASARLAPLTLRGANRG